MFAISFLTLIIQNVPFNMSHSKSKNLGKISLYSLRNHYLVTVRRYIYCRVNSSIFCSSVISG